VVDGNPLDDISLLEDKRHITHVMKGGEFFRITERTVTAARRETPAATAAAGWAGW